MRFIEVTDIDDDTPMYIAVDRIDTIKEVKAWEGAFTHTKIYLGGILVRVKETSYEIMLKIRG
jgi:hypothetical protein